MEIQQLCSVFLKHPQVKALAGLLANQKARQMALPGLCASATPMIFASLAAKIKRPVLFVLHDADEAGYFYHDLTQIIGSANVLFFPSAYKRAAKYGQRDHASEILRTETLARLGNPENSEPVSLYLVTYPQALAEMVVNRSQLDERMLTLKIGQQISITAIARQLRELGFTETDYVYEPGQFALRGSIIDVYSYSCELPYRIDFFGDEIDTIRTFQLETQLSAGRKDNIEIVPELARTKEQKIPLPEFLPDNTLLVTQDMDYINDTVAQIYNDGFSQQAATEQLEGATEVERQQIMQQLNRDNIFCAPTRFATDMERFAVVLFGNDTLKAEHTLRFHTSPQPLFHKNFDLLANSLTDYQQKQYTLFILADSSKQTDRLKSIFSDMDNSAANKIQFTPVDHTLHAGFADNDLRVCLFTDHQIFDRFHKYSLKSDSARVGKMAITLKEIQQMQPGDFLVHVDYGIGKFGGLVRVPVPPTPANPNGGYQEVIRIIYQNNDKVDVSIHSLYKISKYRSSDTGEPPRLSTLGTGAWDRLKEKAKKRIKDIARDLIRLYAKRRQEKGFAFSPDSFMQHELEASFMYEDTPDQYKATQDVKHDMEMAKPMDRLVCGDVGFGKTEVAIRAAFKAAADNKQVAVLVPTTVLAYQHFQTFSKRLHDFPVRVDYLSRARSAQQARQVRTDLADGRIDIIIGTHMLLSKNVKWHDLGLLIIDEEQKFGVSTKEKLRKLKTNVDTLTMSATPIPRTLQFSLMGARDMSIIRTPPPNRYPVQTQVTTFNAEVIADAINFEMSRNGQVYFVSSRISSLPHIAEVIKKYVPDCRVAIGHGQMKPEELEKIIMGFINYDYDVLLSTTIVENGIDIPNANTIIINDAHRFGLSDLHQMRGRVGRSNRKAFCYLLAPPLSVLNPESRRRLEALETFSELGSGFNLAMQDLDIRGAGNLLGAEQSGFMEDLGYETYQKILQQAITELKNEELDDVYEQEISSGNTIEGDDFVEDCGIDSDLGMYFPDTYVPGSSERMLLYRELDNITTDEELQAYRQRLIDRFGPVPHEGEELMKVVQLRRLGKQLGCERLILRQGRLTMQLVSSEKSPYYKSVAFGKVLNYISTEVKRCHLKEASGRRLIHIENVGSVEEAVKVLQQISRS